MSQWIWKFGEYEVYHNMLLHNRRQQYGYAEVPVWKIYSPENAVRFSKEVTTEGGIFWVYACGDFSVEALSSEGELLKYRGKCEINLPRGTYTVTIRVSNYQTFPCLFVEGVIETDASWFADDMTEDRAPVGTYKEFTLKEITPETFPFTYKQISYVSSKKVANGVVFDFGKETFARTKISLPDTSEEVLVSFGESIEEALDSQWSVVHFNDRPVDGKLEYPPYAFRYLYIGCSQAEVEAEYEYNPISYQGAFACDDELINQVWETAAYTFHLNCREFFLDGIKRDRWVWAGDVYQSLFVNRYLFMNPEIEQRTLTALGGKQPFKQHINTIMDYTFFWIMSCYEYYRTYGDRKFLEQIYPQIQEVISFCRARADEDGFVRGKAGDWIFIDWGEMDKTGAFCAEQILFAQALQCYNKISKIMQTDDQGCGEQSERLVNQIFANFYDEEQQVFIDSYESGRYYVSRQNNIIAYLFLPCSHEQKENIIRHVMLNENIPPITTPYFKFYENLVYQEAGADTMLEQTLRDYYGGMLREGATTFYEEYDSEKKGAEHYAMYGNPYEKSLCHAWSASPIYMLGYFRMGVKNTGIAYEQFEVEPRLGGLQHFSGRVPLPHGWVEIEMDCNQIKVLTNAAGGVLIVNGERYLLHPNETRIAAVRK